MVRSRDDEKSRKKVFIPVLILIMGISGMFMMSYTMMISDVTDGFFIDVSDDVSLSLVDNNMEPIEVGGFAKRANNGEGASKIFYTTSSVDGDENRLLYHIGEQSLEFGRSNLNIGVGDSMVKYVKVWYELEWSTTYNPVEEYGLDLKLSIDGLGISLSEGEISGLIDVSEISTYGFRLTGDVHSPVESKYKPETLKYAITIHIESY